MSESQILHIHRYAGEDDIVRVAALNDDGHKSFRDVVTGQVSPKPLAGIRIGTHGAVADRYVAPAVTGISERQVELGQSERWLTVIDPEPGVFAAGTAERPFSKTLTFLQASALVFHTLEGDFTYRVTRNPGKYRADGSPATAADAGDPTAEVFHDYRLELQEG